MAVDTLNDLLRGRALAVHEHRDLWAHVEKAVVMRRENGEPDFFRCRWVPAHVHESRIGIDISVQDHALNQGADKLAVEAATKFAPPLMSLSVEPNGERRPQSRYNALLSM